MPSAAPERVPKVDGSLKNAGTKNTPPALVTSECWVNWLFQPSATESWPNWQVSPAKVDAKVRPLYLNWFGWLAYCEM